MVGKLDECATVHRSAPASGCAAACNRRTQPAQHGLGVTQFRRMTSLCTTVLTVWLVSCAEPPARPDKPRPVRTVTVVTMEGSETLVQTGEIQPRRETDLGFQLEGRLARRAAEVGSVVAKGEVLASLDSGLINNERRAAEANLGSASSTLELAELSLARQQKLFMGQSASQQQMDEANASVRAARAQRDVALVAAENAARKLGYTHLIAEERGIVSAIGANQGQVVTAGQMIVRLATVDRDAVFSVAEHILTSAPPDVAVRVSLVSNPSISVTGTVREVSPSADLATRTYRVRIALPNPPPEMAFGAAVRGTVEFAAGRVIALPASSLTSEASSPAVYVVDSLTKKLQRRAIEVSRYSAAQMFVTSGLEAGELVVTAGVSKLRPGQVVVLGDVDGGMR
jgi:RND family efflux transporter MFP subunit